MKTYDKITAGLAAGAALAALLLASPDAEASPGLAPTGNGCEQVGWGLNLFGNWTQRRTTCDGPRAADGSWTRAREVWVPAGYVRGSSYCGTYSCSYSEGYYRPRTTIAFETYPVTPGTVLPDEPQWLPAGTVVIR